MLEPVAEGGAGHGGIIAQTCVGIAGHPVQIIACRVAELLEI